MRKLFAFILVIFSVHFSAQVKSGGSYKDYFQEGSYLLLEDNYPMATDNFLAAYEIDSANANINYLLGICFLHSATKKSTAERYLLKAVGHVSRTYKNDDYAEKAAPPLAHYYCGQALHINYKFDEAMAQYDNFAKYVNAKDKDWKKLLDKERATCAYAKEQVAAPMNVKITNLGDSINSQYPEYSPVVSSDERMIIYTTRRPNTIGGMKDMTGMYNEDVVVAYKDAQGVWGSPSPISNNINTGGMEASINLSADGQTLIIYKDNGDGMGGNIYYSTFDGKDWTSLKEFGSDVNSKYQETHACLSQDGKVLFFVSDRPGGFGGKDIYRCVKLPNDKWSKALNMGSTINTEYDEDGAFIHPDGVTFFFASKGHKTMGGYDIMFATLNEENKFTEVTNIGYPINTTDDDVFLVTSPDGKRSYFSSFKEGGFGEKDIYMAAVPEAKEKPLALFKGMIVPADGEKLPDDLVITVTDKQTGEIVGIYRPKIVNGSFSTILPPGREYNFSYAAAGEEFYNEDVFVQNELTYQEIKHEINLEPVKLLGKVKAKQKAIVLNTIVFNNSSEKKPLNGAKITLTENGGSPQTFTADEKGKYDGIQLQPEKKYSVYAEANGKKSIATDISTAGVKSGKTITQLLYMSGKPEKSISKDLLLDLTVRDSKKKPVANANVVLTDADGNKTELTTNAKGQVKGIELSPNTKYEVQATKDQMASEKLSFSTEGTKGAVRFNKSLVLEGEHVANQSGNNGAAGGPSEYEFHFKYNAKQTEDDPTWTGFIDNVVALSQKKTVTVNIKASASRVPTRAYKNNADLAAQRAVSLQSKIREAVEAKGGDVKKVKFIKSSVVGGPKYRGDRDVNREVYEKHQYVKASAK
jgi:hypothetical protein